MSDVAATAEHTVAAGRAGRFAALGDAGIRSVGPIVLALVAGAAILLALGRNPIEFYGDIVEGGITRTTGLQDSVTRMAPLLLIAAALVVVFRANIWNLGIDGQFLLAAAMVAGVGRDLDRALPNGLALGLLWLLAAAVGAVWTIVPAFLKARYQVNEIITTLMMTFIGINVANLFIKGPFRDFESTNVPQTSVLPVEQRLPDIPGTSIHVGIVVALVACVLVHFVMTRTAFGLRLNVLGANPRAATHFGLSVPRLVMVSFAVSGAVIGLAGAAEILGVWGYVRADWNPAFGLIVVPLVFLARLNAIAVIPFVALLAVLSIGGDLAARRADLPNDFLLVLVGLILLFMAVTEYLGRRRALGASYLTEGLVAALRRRKRP
ncbi:MAG: ABC transporter permease [Thermoleophilia bacterium]|nr:ABC transporter permease [Thermoleophilia bacterium]